MSQIGFLRSIMCITYSSAHLPHCLAHTALINTTRLQSQPTLCFACKTKMDHTEVHTALPSGLENFRVISPPRHDVRDPWLSSLSYALIAHFRIHLLGWTPRFVQWKPSSQTRPGILRRPASNSVTQGALGSHSPNRPGRDI
jgi:hypothetical protein